MINYRINLLQDQHKPKSLTVILKKLFFLRMVSIFILFGVGVASVSLSIFITLSPLSQLLEEENNLKTQLNYYNLDINKLAFINERADRIRGLLQERAEPDKSLEIIQNTLPANVVLEQIIINDKTFALEFSSKNLQSLNELANAIFEMTGSGKKFTKLFFTELSYSVLDQNFLMKLDLQVI